MHKWLATLLAATCFFVLPAARAQIAPEDGIWSDPSKPGSGFVIELQNDVMAVAAFTYTPTGPATWLLGNGRYNYTTRRFAATAVSFANGQCLGCPYRAATAGGTTATIEIQFQSMVTATVLINGTPSYNITRSYYAYSNVDDVMLGVWAAAYQRVDGTVGGHTLVINQFVNTPTGPGVQGYVDISRRIAIGALVPDINRYLLLVDSSTSFYTTYVYDFTKDQWFGQAYVYPKGSSITSVTPSLFYGARVASKALLDTFTNKAAAVVNEATLEADNWRVYQNQPLPALGADETAESRILKSLVSSLEKQLATRSAGHGEHE